MPKEKLTAGKISAFVCEDGRSQSFLWCADVPGLAIRAVNGSDVKSYIFQSKFNKKTLRITIGNVKSWSIKNAQIEARRLQGLIDTGNDPREVKKKKIQQAEAEKRLQSELEKRESVTVKQAWDEYVAERREIAKWSALHIRDHERVMQLGGELRVRSKEKYTKPGILSEFAPMRLVDINGELIDEWAARESKVRPSLARLALRLFKAFLSWCTQNKKYKAIVTENPADSKNAKTVLGGPKKRDDVLQKEQLPAWFSSVKQIDNPVTSAYLQTLLLIGSRREELATLRWSDIDFRWNTMTIRDKVEGFRVIPLTPYVSHLLLSLPRRNEWVFSSVTSASGRIADPRIAHNKACEIAGLRLTLHGLRRSFASLCEWVEMPSGIAAQIQGHKPQGVREKNYIRRPLDLLRMWHVKIEAWMLEQAGVEFVAEEVGLRLVQTATGV